jgi:branched-chain amino acid transport system ATP-binding protein
VLEVRDLHAGYGHVPILHGIDLSVAAGEIVLMVGPNGAGKSTTLRTVAGFIKPRSGSVELDGRSVVGAKPEALAHRGLRLLLEGHRVFPELSVADNLKLAQFVLKDRGRYAERLADVHRIFPILAERSGQLARELSGGQQQLLALGQSFIGDPKVLLCDEPSFGVAQGLAFTIMRFLRSLADDGMAIVLVEQFVDAALEVADRVIVVRGGLVVASGPASEFKDSDRLQQLFMGGSDTGAPTPS